MKHQCKLIRVDVEGGGVIDKIISRPWEDINIVLADWNILMKNYKEISLEISLNFFYDFPSYKNFFPSFSNVSEDELPYNEDFQSHAFAIVRGIDSIMSFWSGKYEEESDFLDVISKTHFERGLPPDVMLRLRDTIISTCCNYLKASRKQKTSWKVVMDHIFIDHLCSAFPELPQSDEEDG